MKKIILPLLTKKQAKKLKTKKKKILGIKKISKKETPESLYFADKEKAKSNRDILEKIRKREGKSKNNIFVKNYVHTIFVGLPETKRRKH